MDRGNCANRTYRLAQVPLGVKLLFVEQTRRAAIKLMASVGM